METVDDPYAALAAAVIRRALADLDDKRRWYRAYKWLLQDGVVWAELMGINRYEFTKRVKSARNEARQRAIAAKPIA